LKKNSIETTKINRRKVFLKGFRILLGLPDMKGFSIKW
jgi:hypothetical protein